jgi:hypothetical protein
MTELTDPQIDWAARADGKPHTLLEGTHYTRPVDRVRQAAAMYGFRHGLRAVTRSGEGSLTVTFVPRTGRV